MPQAALPHPRRSSSISLPRILPLTTQGLAMYLRSTLHEMMQLSTTSYYDPRVRGALEAAVSRRCTSPGRAAVSPGTITGPDASAAG